ncbi:MAG: hypothetical protein Q9218_004420 [Villophora microphyllina]
MSDAHDHGQRKRMRKGTHSCSECRERKVKCIFSSDCEICDDCLRRGRQCIAQSEGRQSPASYDPTKSTRDHLREIDQNVKQILKRLERPLDACNPPELEVDSLNGLLEELQLEVFRSRLRSARTLPETTRTPSTGSSGQSGAETFAETPQSVPVLSLMNNSVLKGQITAPFHVSNANVFPRARHSNDVSRILRKLMPNWSDLLMILHATKCTWDLWGSLLPHMQDEGVSLMELVDYNPLREEIQRLVCNGEPADLARLLFCLATCIQQLSRDFDFRQTKLPPTPDALQEIYLSAAELVLSMDQNFVNTIDGVECMLIQSTFYVNRGKPRTAWLICQRGISICNAVSIDGLSKGDTVISMRWKAAWFKLWTRDRQLSLLLGLPHASTRERSFLVDLSETIGDERWQAVWTNLSIVAGRLINRNRSTDPANLTASLDIESDMEAMKQSMSVAWDAPDSGKGQQCTQSESQRNLTKFIFHNTRKLLHLPFMLMAIKDKSYEYSREAAVDSSRQMIELYQHCRRGETPVLSLCSIEDFQVFTAALVLVINLLDPGRGNQQPFNIEEIADWQLIEQITVTLREIATRRGCAVALDGSNFLQDVLRSRYDFPKTSNGHYEATVPYFGKISLTRRLSSPPSTRLANGRLNPQSCNAVASPSYYGPVDMDMNMNLATQAEMSWIPASNPLSWGIDGQGWPIQGDNLAVDDLRVDTNNYWWES